MDAQLIAQRDFSAGQLDDTALRADDTDIMKAGLRTARNVRILASRSVRRRPGRRVLFQTSGIGETIRPAAGVEWFMDIEAGSMTFRSKNLASVVQFGSMPWTQEMLPELRWVESNGTVIVAHNGMRPQTFTYDRLTGGWSNSPFAFSLDPSGAVRQPYYNFFLGSGVTMTPSARSGTMTINFSAPVLNASHVGSVFRYAGRQMVIDAVIGPSVGTATVIEELPPVYSIGVDNVNGLQVGDVVEGVTSGAKGQVSAIVGLDVVVLVDKNWSGFEVDEAVAGPRSRMKVATNTLVGTVASTQWDEALMSDFRGWPGCVSKDVQRIIFCRLLQAGSAVCWSSTGTLNDFLVGAEKEDAIFEFVSENCLVLDVQGGADEFVFTDKGVFYVPVSTSNPLIPGSIDFKLISDDPASGIKAVPTTEGLVFINASRSRVFAIIGTGQVARPYVVEDLSEYHSKLIRQPFAIATSAADASAPERYVFASNADGTLAVGRYQKGTNTRGWIGWVPWDGLGAIKWISAGTDAVIVTAEYVTDVGVLRFVERFEDDLLLDGSMALAGVTGTDVLEVSPGVALEVSIGNPLEIGDVYTFNWAAGTTLSVERNGWFRGNYTVQADGSLSGVIPVNNTVGMNGGFNFTVEVEPFVPHIEGGRSVKQRIRRRRIKQLAATVQRSQAVEVAGYLVPFWRAGENEEEAPPLRDDTYRTRQTGRSFDPRWSVKQELPGALTILELDTEVTF
ncbi:hypothetical protein [Bosea sp. BK604]|uniref:hypothetical protein n=1 Tax=Bosea sp. BK604 TaxID=2512180 RepID=UPI001044A03B|nr:hypothetical protein [Bosea sp. BK604]TCR64695.1 hypothetical protein EV560_106161 [Bosea sp. BK604]